MRTNKLIALTLAAALAFAVPACSSSDSAKAPTKAEFIKDADAICKAGDAKLAKAGNAVDASDQKAMDAYILLASTASLKQISDLRALGFPKGDEDELDKALSTFETAFESVRKDPEKVQGLSKDRKLNGAAKTLGTYGLKACGNNG